MKLSKKTILIGISTLLVAGAGLTYYLITKDNPETLGWMSSSWLYRKSIAVANSGSTLTNADVLVVMNTSTLVTAGKLQSDCDDLRFVDSDGSTSLSYWVEAGCNTTTTQVWVRIPSLTAGGKTIYTYYGNASAANAEATWSGNFILMNDAACPTGWTRTTAFDSRYPYGASSYGTAGGATSHDHGTASCTTGAPNTATQNTQSDSGGATASPTHTHTNATVAIDSKANTPPYLDMIYCVNSNLNISAGLITVAETTPSGWTKLTILNSKFARGAATYGGTGGATTHTHTTTGGYTTGSSGTRTDSDGGDVGAGNHTHTTIDGVTGSGSSLPTYMTMLFVSKNSTGYASASLISMTTATPPLGWTRYSTLDGYFVMGAATSGTTGGTSTHTHSVTITTSTGPTNEVSTGDRISSAAQINHYHTCSTTTASESTFPAYRTVLYYERKTSQSATLGSEEVKNTDPNAPTSLLAEGVTNPTRVIDTTPEFSAIFTDADASDTGKYYQVQVNTNSSFTGTVMWDSTKIAFATPITNGARSSDISYAGSTLQEGILYYWRIKFWDDQTYYTESPWSATANFTMNTTPNAPTSLYTEGATNPTRVVDTTPEFSAIFTDDDTSDTGTYYRIQVNTNSSFTGTVMWDSAKTSITAITNGARSTDISYAGTTLQQGTIYYWRIAFWDNNNVQSTWSATANFTMNRTPTAPTSLYTEGTTNPTRVIDTTPEFSAIFNDADSGDTGIYYQIQVNTNSSFTGTVMWDSTKTSMTAVANGARSQDISYAGSTLSQGTIYYWRVAFWDNNNVQSPWSATANFTMNITPGAPTLLYCQGATNPTKLLVATPTFSAIFNDGNSTDTGNYYRIQVNTNSSFTGTVMWDSTKTSLSPIANGARSADITYAGSALQEGTTYYWRIAFWDNNDAQSPWSATANFSMQSSPETPSSLQTNGTTNPTTLVRVPPVFTAIYSDADSDAASAYQIQVNTNAFFTGTVMWDSGKVATSIVSGNRSEPYQYEGTPVSNSHNTLYWRIKFWDVQDTSSLWSGAAQFQDTLLNIYYNGLKLNGLKLN